MKQGIQLLFFICISFLFAGCNQEDFGDIEDMTDDTPIAVKLNATKGVSTRVMDNGYNWNIGDTIGVYMFDNQKPLSAESILEGADNVKFHYHLYYGNFKQSSVYQKDTLYYPPDRQQKVNFIGYYPYKSGITDYTYPIDVTTQTSPTNRMNVLDVMYSNNATDIPRSGDSIYITFTHIMNKVQVKLILGVGGPNIDEATVRITGVDRTAKLNLVDGTIHSLGSKGDIVLTRLNVTERRVFLIPQPAANVKLVITLANNQGEFEYAFPSNMVFEEGIHYSYTITVNKTGIELTENTITDWDGKDEAPIEKTAGKYQVGDYYPDPANPSTAIGIVYEITDGIGYHGKMVSLDDIAYLPWGPLVDELQSGVSGIRDQDDGSTGTRSLIEKRKDEPGFSTTYGFFNWIYQDKNKGDINGRWYLPAIDELKTFQAVWYADPTGFNKKLTDAGFNEIRFDITYRSSTETDAQFCYSIEMDNGTVFSNYTPKTNESFYFRVRAVSTF